MFEYVNYSPKRFSLSETNDLDALRYECWEHCVSKFNNKYKINILNELSTNYGMRTLVITDPCRVRFFEKDFVKVYNANVGDLFSFYSSTQYLVDEEKSISFNFIYLNEEVKHGDGEKKFRIITRLEDEYHIDIYANTLEEAIDLSKTIKLMHWNHVDLFPDVNETMITRYSKWHKFDGKEI